MHQNNRLSLLAFSFYIFIGQLIGQFFGRIALADSPPVPAGSVPAPADPAAAAAGGPPPGSPGMMGMLLPFIVMFAVMYFLMIRPQQKKMKQHQEMLGGLKLGDEVVTASGLLGNVAGLTDKVITLEIAKGVKVKVLKNQVSQIVKGQL